MSDITFVNHRSALIDLCMRNAWKLAVGELEYNHDLGIQIDYAYRESNQQTKELLESIFRNTGVLHFD